MTTEVWQPLKARLAGRQGLREGVPSVMVKPLRNWIWTQALQYGVVMISRQILRPVT